MRQLRPLLLTLLLSPWVGYGAADAGAPTLQRSALEDTVLLRAPGCATQLDHRADQQLLRFRDSCRDGVQASAARLAQLLGFLGETVQLGQHALVLDCGRLAELDPQLSRRLARAADESPAWSSAWHARQASGEHWANRAVATLIDSQGILREFERSLAASGMRMQLRAVEKVLLDQPDGELVSAGVPLPYDAVVWFTLQPGAGRTSPD
jgi:hypothetical protein